MNESLYYTLLSVARSPDIGSYVLLLARGTVNALDVTGSYYRDFNKVMVVHRTAFGWTYIYPHRHEMVPIAQTDQ